MAVWADFIKCVRSAVFKNELKNGDYVINHAKSADSVVKATKADYATTAGSASYAEKAGTTDTSYAERSGASEALIDISGDEAKPFKKGNASTPVYFEDGKPVECHSFGMGAGQINVDSTGSARWNWDVASIYVFSVMLTEDYTGTQYAPTAVIYPVGYADITKSTLITRGFSSEQFVISLETFNGVGYIRLRTLDGQNYQHAGTLNYLKIKLPIVAG